MSWRVHWYVSKTVLKTGGLLEVGFLNHQPVLPTGFLCLQTRLLWISLSFTTMFLRNLRWNCLSQLISSSSPLKWTENHSSPGGKTSEGELKTFAFCSTLLSRLLPLHQFILKKSFSALQIISTVFPHPTISCSLNIAIIATLRKLPNC